MAGCGKSTQILSPPDGEPHFCRGEISRKAPVELNCVPSDESYKPPQRREPASADAMKVLVVEDDPFVREMAVAGLEDAGFEVIEAASGSEALRLLHNRDHRRCPVDRHSPAGSQWLGGGQGLPRALPRSARPVCDRLCGADAARPRRDHPLEALQDGSGDRRPGNMGRLRRAAFRQPFMGGTVARQQPIHGPSP